MNHFLLFVVVVVASSCNMATAECDKKACLNSIDYFSKKLDESNEEKECSQMIEMKDNVKKYVTEDKFKKSWCTCSAQANNLTESFRNFSKEIKELAEKSFSECDVKEISKLWINFSTKCKKKEIDEQLKKSVGPCLGNYQKCETQANLLSELQKIVHGLLNDENCEIRKYFKRYENEKMTLKEKLDKFITDLKMYDPENKESQEKIKNHCTNSMKKQEEALKDIIKAMKENEMEDCSTHLEAIYEHYNRSNVIEACQDFFKHRDWKNVTQGLAKFLDDLLKLEKEGEKLNFTENLGKTIKGCKEFYGEMKDRHNEFTKPFIALLANKEFFPFLGTFGKKLHEDKDAFQKNKRDFAEHCINDRCYCSDYQ